MGSWVDESELNDNAVEERAEPFAGVSRGEQNALASYARAAQQEMARKQFTPIKHGSPISMNNEGAFTVRGDGGHYEYKWEGDKLFANGKQVNIEAVRKARPNWEGFSLRPDMVKAVTGNTKEVPSHGTVAHDAHAALAQTRAMETKQKAPAAVENRSNPMGIEMALRSLFGGGSQTETPTAQANTAPTEAQAYVPKFGNVEEHNPITDRLGNIMRTAFGNNPFK